MDPGLICLFVITILTFIAFCTKKPSKKAIFKPKRNNDAQIQQLIETLDESIAATENDQLKSNTEPFTAFQLHSKHVNLSEFLGLCQKLCNEKKPEVVTVITVQKLYEKECSSGENEYMTKLVSAIKKNFNHGITNDVCKDPFVVTVHIVKKDVFELYCANTKNTEAIRILFAQLNSLIDSHVLETLRSELEKFLMSFVKKSMIDTVLAYFLHKSINAKSKSYDTASCYDFYKDRFLEVILCDSFRTYLNSYLKDMHKTKDIYIKFNNCVADMKFKAQISDRINFDRVLPSFLKSKFVFLSAQIAQEMFLTVNNILSDQNSKDRMAEAFSEPFEDITKTFEKDFSDYSAKKELEKSNYLPLKQHYDKYYNEQFFSKLFCSFNFQDFVITKVAQSELVKQTKKNNEEFATNSTKIILNVELTKENFPKIIHTFSNMNVFERTNENQICYVSFGRANVDIIDNITAQLYSEEKLITWHISADSAHSEDKYDYSITSTHGADSSVIKKRILLDYGTDGNLRQSETTICDIKQVSTKANYRIKKYKTNDYEAFISQDVREYIDSTIRKRVRNILAVYEITNSGESSDTSRSSIYIIYHDKIGEKNDKQIAIACADDPRITTENGHLQTETLRKFRCYKYVSSAVLLELALQIRYLQALPVKFEIPNIITYSVADIYFEENTIRHERINSSTNFKSKVMNLKSGSGNKFRLIAINIDKFLNKESSRPPLPDLPIFKQGHTSSKSEWFVSICDKLILSKYAKYFFANNEHIYHDYLLTWIFAFKQMLADNKSIVNVCRRRVKTAINHYFINSSIEVLLALNKDAEIESIIRDVRQDYPSFDLYTKTIQSIVDEIFFDKFEISKNCDFDYQEKYSEKLLKILNEQNNENPNPDEKPNESSASKDPIQFVSNCKANQAIKKLITKILQKVDEIEDQNGIMVTTILPTMKRENEDNDINDGCNMEFEIFEELEQQAMFFAEIMESDNKKWNNG